MLKPVSFVLLLALASGVLAAPPAFETQEIEKGLTVGYCVRVADINADQRPDLVVADSRRVLWYENPSWRPRVILEGVSKPDNVSLAAHDIDGDGQLDLALGADWNPGNTSSGGTIQWLKRGKTLDEPWTLHPIGEEPTVHRIAWSDLNADGRKELLVVPLHGRGTTRPNFAEQGVRILAFDVPADPVAGPWQPQVLAESLHVTHNFQPVDLNSDGRLELLVASFEGVTLFERGADDHWKGRRIGSGNQETSPNRGASEVRLGRLADGRPYLATIEPWHGFQVVVYTPPEGGAAADALWTRHVLDEQLQWGHAVACANLDDDADEELIIGVRDDASQGGRCGVRIYDPQGADPTKWPRTLVDPGGVNVEDLVVTDFDGDGRVDLVAAGRQSHNLRIYWNRGPAPR
ncbi:MAG: VCBS repeat-containing protein [Pirellulales bacterium]